MPRSGLISLEELARQIPPSTHAVPQSLLKRLARDRRRGAQKLYRRLKKRRDAFRRERKRLEDMLDVERELWRSGVKRIAGVDEVGVGPMAGPLVAAAVVLPSEVWIDGIDDSKRLKPGEREHLDAEVRRVALGIGLGVVGPSEVDRLNVFHAGLRAMQRAVESLPGQPDRVLVDHRTIPDVKVPQTSFTRGDARVFSIACASIVAKVHRDRIMKEMDRLYPGYGFGDHKGYCSPGHQEAVRRLGPSPIHRHSFGFLQELRGEYSELFYEMKRRLQSVRSPREFSRWLETFGLRKERFPSRERAKLTVLAARRKKRFKCS